jgi:hypothetical protein
VLLFDRQSWPLHRAWFIFFLAATAAATLGYFGFAYASGQPGWPGGSSLPGFILGTIGGLIILFEFLLWFRKKVRVWRIGRAQVWMRAHIWLGLLCVPLLLYHSGFRLGGVLSTALMILLLVVIASGVWGLALQQLLPRRMLDDLPAETIHSQIEALAEQVAAEGRQLVRATCGVGEEDSDGKVPEAEPGPAPYLVVGAVRSVGQVQGKVLQTRVPATPVPGAEPLRTFFHSTVEPFLRGSAGADSPLRLRDRAARVFGELKLRLPPAAHPAADTLASLCEQRRQWAEQARLHFWLYNWLWVHFPLSVALVVLMFVHIWVALKYW